MTGHILNKSTAQEMKMYNSLLLMNLFLHLYNTEMKFSYLMLRGGIFRLSYVSIPIQTVYLKVSQQL